MHFHRYRSCWWWWWWWWWWYERRWRWWKRAWERTRQQGAPANRQNYPHY